MKRQVLLLTSFVLSACATDGDRRSEPGEAGGASLASACGSDADCHDGERCVSDGAVHEVHVDPCDTLAYRPAAETIGGAPPRWDFTRGACTS